jgi:hypothetical protein
LYKVNDNTWHHAVLIVDTPANGGSKLYLDGALIGSSPWTGTAQATTSTQDLLIGNMPTSSSNYYQGLIDDVRVYNRALTAGQVTDLYNSTAANYAYHQAITITTGSAGTPSGYSVPVTLNHASLVAAGKSRADGNDVRVYYLTSDNRLVELDRVLDTDPTVGAWNQATTKIWFKTQAAIPANSVDDNYFLYYGAPAATGALANPSNVYLVSDDFESGTLSKWQGDTTYFASTTTRAHTGTRSVQGGPEASLSRYLMANPALDLADVYVEAWWNVSDTTSNDIQTVVRAWSAISPSYRYETTLKPNPTPGWNIAKDLNLTRTELSAPLGTVTANTWTRIGLGVYGTKARMFKDGAQLNPASGSLDVGTDLASGTVGFGKYSLTGTWWIDDVIARRYVDPEPTAALTGVEEGAWGRFGNQSMIVGGDQSGYVYSVDGDSGLLNWTVNFSGSGLNRANGIQAPVAAQLRAYTGASLPGGADLIFVPSYNTTGLNCGTDKTGNKVFALRSTDGAVQWTFNDTCTSAMDYVAGMPAVDYGRNRLYVTSGDGGAGQSTFWFINTLDGTLFGSVALGKIDASPTPSYDGSTVYVAAGATPATTTLYAVKADLTCGTPPCTWTIANATRWSLALGSALTGFIWEDYVTPGKLYFTTADGKVWCIQAGAGCSGWPAGGQVQLGASGSLLVMDTNYAYVGTSPLLSCSGAGISCNGANGDGKLHQVSLANGTDAKVPFPTSGALDGTAVGDVSTETGSEVYVGTNGGRLFKIAVPLP